MGGHVLCRENFVLVAFGVRSLDCALPGRRIALTDNDLYRVRGVSGVKWAVPLFKGQPRAKTPDGTFRVVILLGLNR